MADSFFLVLKLNLERGSNAARVSFNFSCKALIAWMRLVQVSHMLVFGS